jgi:hypothetical protein
MKAKKLSRSAYKQELYTGICLWILVLIGISIAAWVGFRFHTAASGGMPSPGGADAPPAPITAAANQHKLEYIVRYSDVELFSSRAEMTVPETLAFLKEQGVTSIGVFEYTLWSLRKEAGSHVLSNLELAGELAFNTDLAPYSDFLQTTARQERLRLGDYLVFMPSGLWAEQVWDHLGQLNAVEDPAVLRLKKFTSEDSTFTNEDNTNETMELFLIQGARYDYLPHLALGANPTHLANVSAAGLRVSPYLSVRQIETAASAEQALATYDNAALSPVLFEGGVVPGYPRYTAQIAAALNKRNLSAIVYEYHSYPQGMKELAPLLNYNLTVMIPERPLFPSELEILNSFRERKVQAVELQIRNFSPGLRGEELKGQLSLQMNSLQGGLLQERGVLPGEPQTASPLPISLPIYLLMALGLTAFTLLTLRIFLPVRPLPLLLLLLPAMAAI